MKSIQWTPGMSLAVTEKLIIEVAYKFYGRNKTTTAEALGIAVRTLQNKLEKYEKENRIEQQRLDNDRTQRDDQLARARGQKSNETNAGVSMEPVTQITAKRAVSMP